MEDPWVGDSRTLARARGLTPGGTYDDNPIGDFARVRAAVRPAEDGRRCAARAGRHLELAANLDSSIGTAPSGAVLVLLTNPARKLTNRCLPWKHESPVTRAFFDGASRTRTGDLLGAIQALSQLSYSPAAAPV
jgi:hypothetical protein